MSRARGLGGRGRSTLSPIKHIIVRSLPDPLLNPGTRLRVILTAVCRHLHTPGVLAAPACDKHTRIHHRCRLGVHTHTHTHTQIYNRNHTGNNVYMVARVRPALLRPFATRSTAGSPCQVVSGSTKAHSGRSDTREISAFLDSG